MHTTAQGADVAQSEHKASRCEPPQVLVGTTDDMWERELSYEEKLRLARNLIERSRAAGIGCELGTVYGIH
jgi:hypothetical protein